MSDYEWVGNGQQKRGISRMRAEALVKLRGGVAREMPPLEPIEVNTCRSVILPAQEANETNGAAEYYHCGRYSGD